MWGSSELLKRYKLEIQNKISEAKHSKFKSFDNILEDYLNNNGKMIRSLIVVLTSISGTEDFKKTVNCAAAIEILHNATLIHDDIIDSASIRRGKETINSKHGIDMAVYTGDYLFTTAVYLLSEFLSLEYMREMSRSLRSVCVGEVIQYHKKFKIDIPLHTYFRIIFRKTAILFSLSFILGAKISGFDEKTCKLFEKIGYYFGMAFQIQDDLNDVIGTSEQLGKKVFNDIVQGYMTLPFIIGVKEDEKIAETIKTIQNTNDDTNIERNITSIRDALKSSESLDKSNKVLDRFITKMEKTIDQLPNSINKQPFIQLKDHVFRKN